MNYFNRYVLAGLFLAAFLFSATASDSPSQLKPFVRGSWKEILQAHSGRPTLVEFWGVTCGPCKVELPMLGQFMKDHPGIDIVTVSADLVPDLPEATRSMLSKAGLQSSENWIFDDGFVERLQFEVDPAWQGDIPRTVLIARDGTVTTIEGMAEAPALEKWASQQVAEAAPPDPIQDDSFFTHLHTGTAMANITVTPARVGPVDIAIQLETADEAPLTAEAVSVTLSSDKPGNASQTLQAISTGASQWHVKASMPVAGIWMLGLGISVNATDKVSVQSPIVIK